MARTKLQTKRTERGAAEPGQAPPSGYVYRMIEPPGVQNVECGEGSHRCKVENLIRDMDFFCRLSAEKLIEALNIVTEMVRYILELIPFFRWKPGSIEPQLYHRVHIDTGNASYDADEWRGAYDHVMESIRSNAASIRDEFETSEAYIHPYNYLVSALDILSQWQEVYTTEGGGSTNTGRGADLSGHIRHSECIYPGM